MYVLILPRCSDRKDLSFGGDFVMYMYHFQHEEIDKIKIWKTYAWGTWSRWWIHEAYKGNAIRIKDVQVECTMNCIRWSERGISDNTVYLDKGDCWGADNGEIDLNDYNERTLPTLYWSNIKAKWLSDEWRWSNEIWNRIHGESDESTLKERNNQICWRRDWLYIWDVLLH